MPCSTLGRDAGGSEGTYIRNKSSLRLFIRSWSPEQGSTPLSKWGKSCVQQMEDNRAKFTHVCGAGKRTKAAVVLVHGFSWHSGYFEELGQRLARCGEVSFNAASCTAIPVPVDA